MIEELLPGNKTRLKIIKTIYENPGLNLTNLIKKVKASPNLILKYVNKLLDYEIIKEERIGGIKKVHVRNLKPRFDGIGGIIYSLIEIDKKLVFFEKYKNLNTYFLQLRDIIKNNVEFILIYGSYARFSATKDSDLDILIIGNLNREKINKIKEVFISLDLEPSIKIETKNKFLKNRTKPLYQNIIKEHIIIYGEIKFIDMLNI